MHVALLGVHADVGLQPEVPLLAFARLMHLGIALSAAVLGRRRRMQNGRVHNRAPADADAPALQIFVHPLQHGSAHIVFLQQMAEL